MRGVVGLSIGFAALACIPSARAIGNTVCHIDTWDKTVHLSLNKAMTTITQDGVEAIYTEVTPEKALIYIMEFKRADGVELHATTITSGGKMIIQVHRGKTRAHADHVGDAYGTCTDK